MIIVPNRELASQIFQVFQKLLKEIQLNLIVFVGGRRIENDFKEITDRGLNIIISTPGRLADLLTNSKNNKEINLSVGLKSLEILVFDEVDRLMDLGFEKR